MLRSYAVYAVLAWTATVIASPQAAKPSFCSVVQSYVTQYGQQEEASCFCSSYLHIPTTYNTHTVTATKTITKDVTSSAITVATVRSTVTNSATITTTSVATVTSTTTLPTTSTSVIFTTTGSAILTSTVVYTTITDTNTVTVTTTSTSTSTATAAAPLVGCTKPVFLAKKREIEERAEPQPSCFSHWPGGSALSSACSCLSTHTETSTRTVSITKTRKVTDTTSLAATSTTTAASTITSTVTATATSTQTIVSTSTITVTQSFTSAITNSGISITSVASTITTVVTATATSTQVATATVQMYTDFALLSSGVDLYGSVINSVGGSGSGVYFNEGDLGTAATFSFASNTLYYQQQNVNGYAAASGDYYVVVNRPNAEYGYGMACTLSQPEFSGDGCALDCSLSGNGLLTGASGNDNQNYNGAWGFQGRVDNFIVYAVGQE